MGAVKNFTLVVVNLIGDMWLGIGRKPEFYDNHTIAKTKMGYALFIGFAAFIALGAVIWLGLRIY